MTASHRMFQSVGAGTKGCGMFDGVGVEGQAQHRPVHEEVPGGLVALESDRLFGVRLDLSQRLQHVRGRRFGARGGIAEGVRWLLANPCPYLVWDGLSVFART